MPLRPFDKLRPGCPDLLTTLSPQLPPSSGNCPWVQMSHAPRGGYGTFWDILYQNPAQDSRRVDLCKYCLYCQNVFIAPDFVAFCSLAKLKMLPSLSAIFSRMKGFFNLWHLARTVAISAFTKFTRRKSQSHATELAKNSPLPC